MKTGKDLAAELFKLVGANSEKQGVDRYLDTGVPELNKILGGRYDSGAAVGRMIEVFGPASCGKTFLATMIMAAAQRAGGIAGFSDHERSFETKFAKMLGLNVDNDSGQWIYKRPQTFEESIDIAVAFCEGVRKHGLIPDEAPLVWCFDSVAAMIPHDKLYDKDGKRRGAGDYNMRDKLLLAASTSQSYPVLAQFAEDNNMTVLLLNQTREKPGVMYGDPTTTPGGKAAQYYASVRLSIGKTDIKDPKKKGEILGFDVKAKTVKNKITRPFKTTDWKVLFNESAGCFIDTAATNLDLLGRLGLIEKSGGWYTWEGKKYQTKDMEAHFKNDRSATAIMNDMLAKLDEDAIAEDQYTEEEELELLMEDVVEK